MAPTETSYDGTNLIVHFHDPMASNDPSAKFEWWFFLLMMIGIVGASAICVVIMMCCSNVQEKAVIQNKEDNKEKLQEDLKKNLACKPWCGEGGEDATEEMSMSQSQSSFFGNSTRCSSAGGCGGDGSVSDEEMQMPQSHTQTRITLDGAVPIRSSNGKNKDGSACPLCNEVYQPGQPVYESNNPHCGHQCHKVCMDKWLKFQNTCAICNQPFVIHTV